MAIESVVGQGTRNQVYKTPAKAGSAAAGQKEKTEEKEAAARQDQFVRGGAEQPVTYNKKLTGNQLQKMQEDRMQSFQRMLESMVVKQGQKSNMALGGMRLNVTSANSSAAASAIADGGEYSVDAVATRLMDMAKALAGGDASKLEELRQAVQKGFQAAGVKLGGKLPGICQDTYAEVMKRFDDWEKEWDGGSAVEA